MPPRPRVPPAEATAPARVVTGVNGERWLATLVAQIVPEDGGAGRLIVRLESLDEPRRLPRVATLRASRFDAVPASTLESALKTARDEESPRA